MTPALSPAAEFRLARVALRGVVDRDGGRETRRQATALAAARMVALFLPLLARDDRGEMTAWIRTEGSHIAGRNTGDWTLDLKTLPDFHRRLERQATWRDARRADEYGDLFPAHARREGREEIDVVSDNLSLFLIRAALEAGRKAGEVVVQDAHGPLLVLRIRRSGPLARIQTFLGRALGALGLGPREIARARYGRQDA